MGFEAVPTDDSLVDPLPVEPLALVARWFAEARERSGQQNPDAMTIATVDDDGSPQARVVLCRGFDAEAGVFTFYTNRQSAKGRELAGQPRATAVFYWDSLSRQLRVSGAIGLAADEVSDAYFAGRPRASQIAAWASQQSAPVASRDALLHALDETAARFGGLEGETPVPRPPHWGGYCLHAERVECWVGSRGRAHDRARWQREPDGTSWSVERLQP
ncbi:MAG: pyridoxamine 5'-phosphate oxidase [Myxococcota bacterium]